MANYHDNSSLGWKILSLFLALVMVAGIITGVVFWQKGNIVFNPVEQEQSEDNGAPVTDENGEDISSTGTQAMPKAMTFRSATALDGKDATYDSVTLKATVKPENTYNKAVDWEVLFVNPSSSWANGKTVTDYVTVTPQSDGSTTATVKCLKPFSEKIKVVVTSRSNTEAKAECTVDFAKRLTSFSLGFYADASYSGSPTVSYSFPASSMNISGKNLADAKAWKIDNAVYTDGTVDNSFKYLLKFDFSSEITSVFKSLNIPLAASTSVLFPSSGSVNDSQYSLSNLYLHIAKLSGSWTESAFEILQYGMKLQNYFAQHAISNWGTVTVQCVGTYTNSEFSMPFSYAASAFEIFADSVELEDTNVVI